MSKEKLDVKARQYRFWKLLPVYAPEVRQDLFDREPDIAWKDPEWLARWQRSDPDNPRGTGPHPAALGWCERWGLPDWCLVRAEHALSMRRGNSIEKAWSKSVDDSIYFYIKPPPFEFKLSLWPAGSAYEPLTREECRERILTAAAKAAGAYFDNHVKAINEFWEWFSTEECRKFDQHCRWLILHLFKGLKARQIVELEDAARGSELSPHLPFSDNTIISGWNSAARLLGFVLPKQKGRPPKRKGDTENIK